ncbi:MAG: hypothetical protein V3V97_20465 [Hyphomicrobiaceae bacterium]
MNKLLLILTGTVLLSPATAYAQSIAIPDVPAMSVTLNPPNAGKLGGYVQGQIVLRARVASRYPFEELNLHLPEITNAEVIKLVRPRSRKVRSYGGDGYVFETVLGIFPTASGRLVIPPVRVEGKVEPEPGREVNFTDESAPMKIEIAGIDASYDDPWWMVSERVDIAERWSKPVEEFRVGDIVRREVEIVAFGVTTERMPIPEHGRTRGIEVADAGGTASTDLTADGAIGTVTRAWDLKIDRGGVLYVSPIGVAYWDPLERVRKKIAIAGLRIEPLPADGRAIAEALMREARVAHDGNRMLAAILIAIAFAPVAAFLAVVLWSALPTRADMRLLARCRSTTAPDEAYRATLEWSKTSHIPLTRVSLQEPELDPPASFCALQDAVHGSRRTVIVAPRVAPDLIRMARQLRLRRCWKAMQAVFDRFAGPRLNLGVHDPK